MLYVYCICPDKIFGLGIYEQDDDDYIVFFSCFLKNYNKKIKYSCPDRKEIIKSCNPTRYSMLQRDLYYNSIVSSFIPI